jgi:murein hydrolase activator
MEIAKQVNRVARYILPKQVTYILGAIFLLPGLLTLFLVLYPEPVWAEDDGYLQQRNRMQLNRVIKKLMDEKKAFRKTKGEEKGLLADLERIDRNLAKSGERLSALIRQRESAQKDLPRLAQQVDAGRLRVVEMRQQLKFHVRLMYGLGGQGVVKVAFSQDNSARVRQSVLYYGRLIKSRNAKFKDFNDSIQDLKRSAAEYRVLVAQVAELADELMLEREQELDRRQQRADLLESLQQEQEFRQKKIEELTLARSSLTSFMERLSGVLASKPVEGSIAPEITHAPSPSTSPKKNFAQRENNRRIAKAPEPKKKQRRRVEQVGRRITKIKGNLPFPVIAKGQSRKPGLFFRIAKNSPVRAIHGAQVVYADWFRGYGLLIILNHGDHIYSLYGHNKKLLVAPGDRVKAYQMIAHTGDTGSLEGIPGLYFEIRRRGQAENPKRWLVSSR